LGTPSGTPSPGPGWSSPSPSPAVDLTGYVWPLVQARVTLPFGPTSWGEFIVDGQLFHDGVDMATQCGDNVHAAHDGVVLAASRQYDDYMGWTGDLAPYYHLLDTKHWWDSLPIVIVIDDGDGYRSIYAHESRVIVKLGQHVKAGQVIGYEGATGNATGCHVHFGLFSPTETATFQLDPAVVTRDLLPSSEIARIDPLLVLPFRCEISEMRTLRPIEAAPCPPLPSASPSSSARAGKSPRAAPTKTPRGAPTPTPTATPTPSSDSTAAT
jgi:murein DD-endopeptidase MepM/ murein hydrolase activator NlpD